LRSRRGSLDEPQLERDLLQASRRISQLREQDLGGDPARLLERLPDAR
jgi:hypothetical protein